MFGLDYSLPSILVRIFRTKVLENTPVRFQRSCVLSYKWHARHGSRYRMQRFSRPSLEMGHLPKPGMIRVPKSFESGERLNASRS